MLRGGAEAPGDADRPSARRLARAHVNLRVADDGAFRRMDAQRRCRLQDRVRRGLLARHGIPAEDEGEEREQAGGPEGFDGRVAAFVTHGRELPCRERGECLADPGVGAHAVVNGLGLDPLELDDGLREFVPAKAAPLRVDDLDRRADPLCRLRAG